MNAKRDGELHERLLLLFDVNAAHRKGVRLKARNANADARDQGERAERALVLRAQARGHHGRVDAPRNGEGVACQIVRALDVAKVGHDRALRARLPDAVDRESIGIKVVLRSVFGGTQGAGGIFDGRTDADVVGKSRIGAKHRIAHVGVEVGVAAHFVAFARNVDPEVERLITDLTEGRAVRNGGGHGSVNAACHGLHAEGRDSGCKSIGVDRGGEAQVREFRVKERIVERQVVGGEAARRLGNVERAFLRVDYANRAAF